MLTSIDQKTLTYLFFNGNQNYEFFAHLKEILQQNPILKNNLLNYSLPYKQRIDYEFKCIKEITRLFKEKILNINHVKFLSYFLQYSHSFEVHFGIFRNIIESYGSESQFEEFLPKIDQLKCLGSVLLSEINLFNNQRIHDIEDVTTKAIYDHERKVFTLVSEESNCKLCKNFSVFSTHLIVFARLFIEGNCFGVYPFLINFRDSNGEIQNKISMEWMGKVFGERTNNQFLIRFNSLEIPQSAFIYEEDITKLNANSMKKSFLKFKVAKLSQNLEESRKSLADLHKAVYIVTKYNNFRTQFSTLEESKDERKIITYQNNSSKILKALCESIVLQIGLNSLENNQKMILSNISKNVSRIEYLSCFINAFRSHLFKLNFGTIQNLRENCGGYGFLQYSGMPNVQENALLNATLESNQQDNLANLALILLKKLGSPENCEKFNNFYFTLLYDSEKLEKAYSEIEALPSKSLENFAYLGRLFNLKCSLLRRRIMQKCSNIKEELNLKLAIKNDPSLYEDIIKFSETLIDYYCVGKAIDFIVFVIYRPVNKFVLQLLNTFIIERLLADYNILIDVFKGKNVNEMIVALNEQKQKNYEFVMENFLFGAIESFEFDENSLNCILEGDRDQFYANLFETMKNNNKRNNPETVRDIVKPLIQFLNRPNL